MAGRINRTEMNDTSVAAKSSGAGNHAGVISRAFVCSITVTRASARRDGASWSVPTSTAQTCAAPKRSIQSVNPPVDAPTSTARQPVRSSA